jgi:chemotaxis methyl-accepting protein methylase
MADLMACGLFQQQDRERIGFLAGRTSGDPLGEAAMHRFFTREGEHYRLRQKVRDLVLFAVHDLLKDPPFSHVDLVSCRNVMIYLDRELQEQVSSCRAWLKACPRT